MQDLKEDIAAVSGIGLIVLAIAILAPGFVGLVLLIATFSVISAAEGWLLLEAYRRVGEANNYKEE